jgi:hypothetical protein
LRRTASDSLRLQTNFKLQFFAGVVRCALQMPPALLDMQEKQESICESRNRMTVSLIAIAPLAALPPIWKMTPRYNTGIEPTRSCIRLPGWLRFGVAYVPFGTTVNSFARI